MHLHDLDTPALVLDRAKLRRNLARMREKIATHGVMLRPHLKTAKSIDVARLALAGQSGAVTVSTLKEAKYFFDNNINDILYAVGIGPGKLEAVAALRAQGAEVTVILDSIATATALAQRGRALGTAFPALIEIDCDGHRSGVRPGDPALVDIGRALVSGGGVLRGVMTHAGASYDCRSVAAIRDIAERERAAVVRCADELRHAGLPCPVVSVGSTPTATCVENLDGVTEVRAGVYMFFDLVMAGLAVCTMNDIALSVLTTVIGHRTDTGRVITDAGWMALSRDRGTAKQRVDHGYGVVCDVAGRVLHDLVVAETNQEHGIIADRNGRAIDPVKFPVGTLLRILPNHACATAAQHAAYHVVEAGTAIEAVWPRLSGW